jgi:hypothetical protein
MDITIEYFPEYFSTFNPTDRLKGLAKEEVANAPQNHWMNWKS